MQFTNIIKRPDNSYVIDHNGYPYHVPITSEFMELWEEVDMYALEHPDEVGVEPGPTLEEIRTTKLFALKTAYDHALAGAVALADPSPVNVALESAMLAVEDMDGLIYIRERLETARAALEQQINNCESVAELEGITITFPF